MVSSAINHSNWAGTIIFRVGMRFGAWAVVLAWTIAIVMLSAAMTAIVFRLIYSFVNPLDIALNALIAGVISPPIIYSIVRLQLQLNMARQELQRQVNVDALTGVATRPHFSHSVTELLHDLSGNALPACMLMIDIDCFKAINDGLGHAAGDDVLREFSATLRRELRRQDILGRYGGEEFAIFLPATNASDGGEISEQLRLATLNNSTLKSIAGRAVTISIGFVNILEKTDLNSILAAADRAMYRAKNQGRNQVCKTSTLRQLRVAQA